MVEFIKLLGKGVGYFLVIMASLASFTAIMLRAANPIDPLTLGLGLGGLIGPYYLGGWGKAAAEAKNGGSKSATTLDRPA